MTETVPIDAKPADHFEDLERQAHAARLGMWVFLASELMLFGGMFALFSTYQVAHPEGFHEGVRHSTKVLGSINTAVLLVSSFLVAAGVHALRAGSRRLASWLVTGTIALGAVFLVIKASEYGIHFHEGIFPGGSGEFFLEHTTSGLSVFWTLYYVMTGLHAVHVTVGMIVLWALVRGIRRGTLSPAFAHRLENGAIYWHLIDVVWIFLWPLYYLA